MSFIETRAWWFSQVYSCWGTFKAFKKGKKEDVCFAGGIKCEGHFLFIKPVCDAKIAVRCMRARCLPVYPLFRSFVLGCMHALHKLLIICISPYRC